MSSSASNVSPCHGADLVYDCEDEHIYCLACDRPVPCSEPGCRTPAQHFSENDEPLCVIHAIEEGR